MSAPTPGGSVKALFDAFNEYSVLVFPSQRLSDEQQIGFSRRFGPLEETVKSIANNPNVKPEIAFLANIDPDGNLIGSHRQADDLSLREPDVAHGQLVQARARARLRAVGA
jgi:alpha-ketoglutarate-dependent taurine dioxygenase